MIFKKDKRTIHFIHIPKCGGTSILKILLKNCWEVDKDHNQKGQHQHFEEYKDYISDKKIDVSFALVRNPIDKILSEIYFIVKERNKTNNYPVIDIENITERGIVEFLSKMILDCIIPSNFKADNNHWLQQYKFIHKNVNIFKIEAINELEEFLKKQNIIEANHNISCLNKSSNEKKKINFLISPTLTQFLYDAYYYDYKFFNYSFPNEMMSIINEK